MIDRDCYNFPLQKATEKDDITGALLVIYIPRRKSNYSRDKCQPRSLALGCTGNDLKIEMTCLDESAADVLLAVDPKRIQTVLGLYKKSFLIHKLRGKINE